MYSYTNKNKISSVKGEKHDFQTVAGGPRVSGYIILDLKKNAPSDNVKIEATPQDYFSRSLIRRDRLNDWK